MIIKGLIIILVILIIANFAIGIFNRMAPPCMDADEYFQGAYRLPDDAAAGLGSIPTHTWQDYTGAKLVATGQPGVIGLTSHNQKNGYIGNTYDRTEGYINPVIKSLEDDDPSDCKDQEISQKAKDAIDDILQPGKRKTCNPTHKVAKAESLTEYDASALTKTVDKSMLKNHRSMSHNTARDGYTSRPGDKCL